MGFLSTEAGEDDILRKAVERRRGARAVVGLDRYLGLCKSGIDLKNIRMAEKHV
jgi:hypothetical protein